MLNIVVNPKTVNARGGFMIAGAAVDTGELGARPVSTILAWRFSGRVWRLLS